MTKLRKGVAYRHLKRPYTRKSKYRSKSFVRGSPQIKIVRYNMGDFVKKFPVILTIHSNEALQLRHNAIESARLTSNRLLEVAVGKGNFYLKLRIYPHHILRENPLAAGAGADRMSTGMQLSFGKPIGNAAQVRKGQVIAEVGTERKFVDTAKKALHRMAYKLPCSTTIEIHEEKEAVKAA